MRWCWGYVYSMPGVFAFCDRWLTVHYYMAEDFFPGITLMMQWKNLLTIQLLIAMPRLYMSNLLISIQKSWELLSMVIWPFSRGLPDLKRKLDEVQMKAIARSLSLIYFVNWLDLPSVANSSCRLKDINYVANDRTLQWRLDVLRGLFSNFEN